MANQQQLALLRRGARAWNEWRILNRSTPVDLNGGDLSGTDLTGANLTGADLKGANLTNADLKDADLKDATLTGAYLRTADLMDATLIGADLHGALLTGASLQGADLTTADLTTATLIAAELQRAVLIGAGLQDAVLGGADLTGADLQGADLTNATLVNATLTRAMLADANLTNARLSETALVNVDLSQTRGLDTVIHAGPSTIDHRTLVQSGRLPLVFLRGCGLPDRLIDYLPSLLDAGPIQFYSCFISYSTANQDFADRLHADLQAKGVRCWFAPHDMKPGRKIHEQVDEAIRVYDRLLLILSTESMSSRWVKTEIAKARTKEVASNRRVLFPIALVPFTEVRAWTQFNADLGEDTAHEIRELFLPNFSEWKTDHDAYQRSLEKVVAALQSADAPAPGT